MAGKPKASAPQTRTEIAGEQFWQDPKTGIWTHIPATVPQGYGPNSKIGWKAIWCAGYDVDEKGNKHYHQLENIPCHCPPGPHIKLLQSVAYEVAAGGGRGSAKTEDSFGFLVKGNMVSDPANIRPVDISYLNCPEYKFLVLRRNAKDLKDYFERAKKFFAMFRGEPTESPMGMRFPSGAWGIFDHLADSDAYMKYQGAEFTRIVLEEAGLIPEEILYLQVLMSCRSSHPDLIPQMMLTFNPGGPGARWINARFIDLKNPDGALVKQGEVYTPPEAPEKTRVFYFSTVSDNPYYMAKGYDKTLDLLKTGNPTLYKRWRLGDFSAIEGQYFESFREKRQPNEPPEALHVIEPIKLGDNWPRAIGMDWGYSHKSAVGWGCWHPKGQLHVYREFVVSRMGTVEIGAEIAKRSRLDLERMDDPHLALYLSHDAFHRDDDVLSEAELIKQGIDQILGKDAAFVMSPTQEEEFLDDKVAWDSVLKRHREMARKTHITITNAGTQGRKAGFNLMREYMRWWPILADEHGEFNEEIGRKILLSEGALAYHEYKAKTDARRNEVLPKLQIWSCCPECIKGVVGAVEAENDPEDIEKVDGDDVIDMLGYLVRSFLFEKAKQSRGAVVAEKLAAIKEKMPNVPVNVLIMAGRAAEAAWDKQHSAGTGFNIPRMAGPTRRMRMRSRRAN